MDAEAAPRSAMAGRAKRRAEDIIMSEWIDSRTRLWAIVAVVAGIGIFVGIELIEEPTMSLFELVLELLKTAPLVLTSVGVVLLFQVTRRQRDEHLQIIRDLEIARVQGHRWRSESRSLLNRPWPGDRGPVLPLEPDGR